MGVRNVLLACATSFAVGTADAQTEPVAIRPSSRVDSARLASLLDTTTRRDSTASDTASRASAPPKPGCYRAQPKPSCLGFLVTDVGMEMPLYTTRRDVAIPNRGNAEFQGRIVWSLGLMRNTGNGATGPVVSLVGEFAASGISRMAEWRYRRWLGATNAVDVGVGYKTTHVTRADASDVPVRGFTAMAGWTPNRWVGVSGRVDIVGGDGQTHRAVMLGIQSTRGSEFLARLVMVEMWRALLAKIGLESESD